LNLSADDIHTLAKNSFMASFLSDEDKNRHIAELERIIRPGANR